MKSLLKLGLAVAVLAALALQGCGEKQELILATTTSTENSGLLSVLIPAFEEASD